jgi:hypothetical protein
MPTRRPILLALLLLAAAFGASGQDSCQVALGTPDITLIKNDSKLRLAAFHQLCAMTFQQHSQQWGADASFEYEAVGGSGSYNQQNYEQFRHDQCETTDLKVNKEEAEYYFAQRPDVTAVQAWLQCMQSQNDFTCWIKPLATDESELVIKVSNHLLGTGNARVYSSYRSPNTRVVSGGGGTVHANELIKPNTIVRQGTGDIVVSRDPHKAFVGTIDIERGGARFDCDVAAPELQEGPCNRGGGRVSLTYRQHRGPSATQDSGGTNARL